MAQLVKNLPAMWETWVRSLGWEDLLEKWKVTYSSILAWRSPWACKDTIATFIFIFTPPHPMSLVWTAFWCTAVYLCRGPVWQPSCGTEYEWLHIHEFESGTITLQINSFRIPQPVSFLKILKIYPQEIRNAIYSPNLTLEPQAVVLGQGRYHPTWGVWNV